eukprot:jgi/Bigna1/67885/fgenesh1_pg.4_\
MGTQASTQRPPVQTQRRKNQSSKASKIKSTKQRRTQNKKQEEKCDGDKAGCHKALEHDSSDESSENDGDTMEENKIYDMGSFDLLDQNGDDSGGFLKAAESRLNLRDLITTLYHSERAYKEQLTVIMRVFRGPMISMPRDCGLTPNEIKQIFGPQIDDIYRLVSKNVQNYRVSRGKKVLSSSSSSSSSSQSAFSSSDPYAEVKPLLWSKELVDLHKDYAEEFGKVIGFVRDQALPNRRFLKYLKTCGYPLMEHLLKPIKRLETYCRQLERLKNKSKAVKRQLSARPKEGGGGAVASPPHNGAIGTKAQSNKDVVLYGDAKEALKAVLEGNEDVKFYEYNCKLLDLKIQLLGREPAEMLPEANPAPTQLSKHVTVLHGLWEKMVAFVDGKLYEVKDVQKLRQEISFLRSHDRMEKERRILEHKVDADTNLLLSRLRSKFNQLTLQQREQKQQRCVKEDEAATVLAVEKEEEEKEANNMKRMIMAVLIRKLRRIIKDDGGVATRGAAVDEVAVASCDLDMKERTAANTSRATTSGFGGGSLGDELERELIKAFEDIQAKNITIEKNKLKIDALEKKYKLIYDAYEASHKTLGDLMDLKVTVQKVMMMIMYSAAVASRIPADDVKEQRKQATSSGDDVTVESLLQLVEQYNTTVGDGLVVEDNKEFVGQIPGLLVKLDGLLSRLDDVDIPEDSVVDQTILDAKEAGEDEDSKIVAAVKEDSGGGGEGKGGQNGEREDEAPQKAID